MLNIMADNPKVCLYSCITSGYDDIPFVPAQSIKVDKVLFVDHSDWLHNKECHDWKIRTLPVDLVKNYDPVRSSRYPKIMSHKFFQPRSKNWLQRRLEDFFNTNAYDWVIWMDARILVKSPDFVKDFIQFSSGTGLGLLKHPDRKSVYEEVQFLSFEYDRFSAYRSQYLAQYAKYVDLGFEDKNLWAAMIIVRKCSHISSKVNQEWWEELENRFSRDQISFPFVLWKNSVSYNELPIDVWHNDYFDVGTHLRD